MSAITIATAQNLISPDVQVNGDEIRRLMHEAHHAGARLIHFPEGALSGYTKAQINDWANVDWAVLQNELYTIMQLAKSLQLWSVIGCNHRLRTPYRPYNSLYVISDQGALQTRYDKRFCSHAEITDWYTPGTDPVYFDVDGLRFGCALCIEIQFPELWREYEQLDVDCVLFSAYSKDPMFAIQAQGHAACNNYWVSFSVPANASKGCPSRLIGPSGKVVATCLPEESTLTVNQLDPADERWMVPLQYARPWRRKARMGEIYRERYVLADAQNMDNE